MGMANEQAARQAQAQPTEDQARSLLEEILDKHPGSRYRVISDALDAPHRIKTVEEVLHDSLKSQARRFVKRAMMYFSSNPELAECPPDKFVLAVIRAAEIGLALDGKLCYCIPYKKAWQAVPDYKGLIFVAKRSRQITDCYARIIFAEDQYRTYEENGVHHLYHQTDLMSRRSEVVGAYAVVKFPNGDWNFLDADIDDLTRIQNRAPSKSGPWSTDVNEMRKKTVIRRLLKTNCDDPAAVMAMQMMDEYDELGPDEKPTNGRAEPSAALSRLASRVETVIPPEPNPPAGGEHDNGAAAVAPPASQTTVPTVQPAGVQDSSKAPGGSSKTATKAQCDRLIEVSKRLGLDAKTIIAGIQLTQPGATSFPELTPENASKLRSEWVMELEDRQQQAAESAREKVDQI